MKWNNEHCSEFGLLLICIEPYLSFYEIVIKGHSETIKSPSLFTDIDSAKKYAESFLKEYLEELMNKLGN